MTELTLVFMVGFLAFIGLWIVERAFHERTRERYEARVQDLHNRLMARGWPEYIAMKTAEKHMEPVHEEPVRKTDNYDGAWTH